MILRYNPTCELAIRQDRMTYTPPQILAKMESDLAPLMAFLSTDGDKIIGSEPDPGLRGALLRAGHSAKFISENEATGLVKRGEALRPWGESRALFAKFGLADKARAWDLRETLSRKTSVYVENAAQEALGETSAAAPTIAHEASQLANWGGQVAIKSLWSAAGRGVRFFSLEAERDAAHAFAEQCVRSDGAVVIERKLDRIAELSFLFERSSNGVRYLGANAYRSASGGAFGVEIFGPRSFAEATAVDRDWEAKYSAVLCSALSKVLVSSPYAGPIGVDAMVYEGQDGRPRLRCCMEVNLRLCMGNVANQVKRLLSPEACGYWRIEKFGGDGEWDAFCARQEAERPVVYDSEGLISKGFFRLTSLGRGIRFGACGWAGSPLHQPMA